MRRAASLLVAVAVLIPGSASAHRPIVPFGKPVYVLGDSLSDTGNLQALQGPNDPPYDPYRASNGPIWVDGVASLLRTSIRPSSSGGTNLSFAGATLATANKWDWTRSGEEMVQEIIGEDGAVDPRATYVIVLGVNDLDRPFYEGVSAEDAARAAFEG